MQNSAVARPRNTLANAVGDLAATERSLVAKHRRFRPGPHPGGGESPLEKFSPPLEKYVGHNLKVLDIV